MFPGAASSLSTPPTPFADRESLEAELKALEKDIDHIQQLKMLNGWGLDQAHHGPVSTVEVDQLSDGSSLNSYEDSEAAAAACMAALYQLRDIDSFIANVTVPPPPTRSSVVDSTNLDESDFTAFIIPPPPLTASKSNSSTLTSAVAVDREVNEVKVLKETKEKISPKIASIQQRFLNNDFKGLQDTLTRTQKKQPAQQSPDQAAADLPPPPPPPRSSAPAKKYEFGSSPQAPSRPNKLSLDNVVQVKSALSKMSLTSSSDSLSSNASVNTVKSVSPVTKTQTDLEEAPPSLPPRQSPNKSPSRPRPPLASPEESLASPPSKPELPSRASKPTLSPLRALPPVPAEPKAPAKAPPPPPQAPPVMSRSYPSSPVKSIIVQDDQDEKPKLPSKTSIGGRKLPAPPANGPKPKENGLKMEVYTNNHFDHEDGTSVDNSDIDEDDESVVSSLGSPPKTKLIIGAPVGESNDYDDSDDGSETSRQRKATFARAEGVLLKVLEHIGESWLVD